MSNFVLVEPTLADVVSHVEADLPGWFWMVGRCDCGNCDGPYAARITSPDFRPAAMAIDLAKGGFVELPPAGHDLQLHGATAQGALGKTLEKTLEKVR